MPSSPSIFRQYYAPGTLVDRFVSDPTDAVDVIIPVIHSNELWSANLHSIFREIPVQRLLLGDGGCIDETIAIAKQFPRVEVFDHRAFQTLGYSIRKLIEEVTSGWFIYLHSDVYLPPGWFAEMKKNQQQYDWFECNQQLTALIEYPLPETNYRRPLSGSQMGRTEALQKIVPEIDDDYLYRNEDLVLTDLAEHHGLRYGRVHTTFHYHQMMNKKSAWQREFTSLDIKTTKSREEDVREHTMQVRGLIKYTKPKPIFVEGVRSSLRELRRLGVYNPKDFSAWVRATNPAWLPFLNEPFKERGRSLLLRLYRHFFES